MESELARVQHTLDSSEEARQKAKDEASRLADERFSLLLDLRASKDELIKVQVERLLKRERLWKRLLTQALT